MARHSASKEAQARAQKKWDAAHRGDYFNFYVKLKKANDQDIINHLETIENRAEYIRNLIRADMASGK